MHSKETTVCVLTGQGMAAISSIVLAGVDARAILEKVFRAGNTTAELTLAVRPDFHSCLTDEHRGKIIYGSINDGERNIDEVVVGYEDEDMFVIHSHGNPLLVEQIVKLFKSCGAVPVNAERVSIQRHQHTSKNTIEAEARLAMQTSATLLGVKILQLQIDNGLSVWAQKIIDNFTVIEPEKIRQECIEIVKRSEIAQRVIEGVKIVIAGPPNSGKSTLLNCFAGQERAIVSDTAGTTRDWVSVAGQVGAIRAKFIDTAGLDDLLAGADAVEENAQQITKTLLDSCNLVLYVTSVSDSQSSVFSDYDKPIIYVYNKCDFLPEHTVKKHHHNGIYVSAKNNEGTGLLAEEIVSVLGVNDLEITAPVAFTRRQQKLIASVISDSAMSRETFECLLYGALSA